MFDLNNAQTQRTEFDLIPDGTIVPVQMTVRPGNAGEGGWLKRSSNIDTPCLMIDAEFIILEGEHAKRKIWSLFTVEGTTDGHQKAADITLSRLRGIVESARGVKPTDNSPEAVQARRLNSVGDLDGIRFWAVIGVEKSRDERYKDKNNIKAVITPDRPEWRKLEQVVKASAASPTASATAATAQRPAWA